uniref:Methyltransferase FkbM domain-containing protein n=1 Tax=Scylla olivacea TaxID=85551 RepID=A0A0P4WI08_SCYOL
MEQHISLGSSGLMEYKHNDTQVGSVTEVQCVPLYTVIRALGRTHIDFLSLDVEHAEMGILDTVPWGEISFTVMAIEHTTQDDLVSYLDQRGYQHVGSFLADHIFVNKKNI